MMGLFLFPSLRRGPEVNICALAASRTLRLLALMGVNGR